MNEILVQKVRATRSTLRILLALMWTLPVIALLGILLSELGVPHIVQTFPTSTSTPHSTTITRNASPRTPDTPTQTLPIRAKSPQAVGYDASRITDPYPFPTESTAVVAAQTRTALVNILCISKNRLLGSISGSGVFIDPRGVILTNAHIAQYVLLATNPGFGISCTVRAGSPAVSRWIVQTLYIPSIWVFAHYSELAQSKPSTGEHDYALLLVTGTTDGSPLSPTPSLPIDAREAVAFPSDNVLVASYPAEFLGAVNAQFNLHPLSTLSSIRHLYTFSTQTADILSLGGIEEAQSGSSGGAVVNMWGYLVGLITTASAGNTTADRDLRALTLSYINRDLRDQLGFDLTQLLALDVGAYAADFNAHTLPSLIALYGNSI